jgi:AAA domain, putative AbiEii toxin, Type IV TA system
VRLLKYRVTDFRSVADSGWIECDDVTTLIGTNEAGKTNLLTPLWKLNPAKGGEIDAIRDYPRAKYADYRTLTTKPVFIDAHFALDQAMKEDLAQRTGASLEDLEMVSVGRRFDGTYQVTFPNAVSARLVERPAVEHVLDTAQRDIDRMAEAGKGEAGIQSQTIAAIQEARRRFGKYFEVTAEALAELIEVMKGVNLERALRASTIGPRFQEAIQALQVHETELRRPQPHEFEGVATFVLGALPSFVYYSNYGNLDSEIYLPHVIDNLQRDDLTGTAAAKARTLRVLFDFVNLSPEEILELGQDLPKKHDRVGSPVEPSEAEIEAMMARKKEREILLQSASTKLTQKFREWWKQGEYRFRFQADGNLFRIWVSDDRRPEEIELESRSTGLQWFLSFYLVFLVESEEAHSGSILLLDEAGLSLHALAQHDLIKFFDGLAEKHQILNSTHSPFLVDSNHLDRVKAVYVDDRGFTVATPDLRQGSAEAARHKSIYAVHAALGLTVSDVILQGCQPVIVEGASDQFYLTAVKQYLIQKGGIQPKRELVFIPSNGTKGIAVLASIVGGKNDEPPFVLVDADQAGRSLKGSLIKGALYEGHPARVIDAKELCGLEDAEVEDLWPGDFIADVISRYLRSAGREEDFDEAYTEGSPIVPQVLAFARNHDIPLDPGWKVEVARRVKQRVLGGKKFDLPDPYLSSWIDLFKRLNT